MAKKNDFGLVAVRVNGKTTNITGDNVEYSVHTQSGETEVGLDKTVAVKYTPKPAKVKFTIRNAADVNTKDFENMVAETIFIEMNNGKTVTFQNCRQIAEGMVIANEGKMDVEFDCDSGEELTTDGS